MPTNTPWRRAEIRLGPGDLYFFNNRLIHGVPGVDGVEPRMLLVTSVGCSPCEEEVFVRS